MDDNPVLTRVMGIYGKYIRGQNIKAELEELMKGLDEKKVNRG